MNICLAKEAGSPKMTQWKEVFRIAHFSEVIEYRLHLKHLLELPNASPAVEIVPFTFHLSRRINADDIQIANRMTDEFLKTHFQDSKFIVFQIGDYPDTLSALKGHFVYRESCPKGSPGVVCMHYSCFYPESPKPITTCNTKFSFQGNINNDLRSKLHTQLKNRGKFIIKKNFFYHLPPEEIPRARLEYLSLMEDSQYILCPRGAGENSIRFFESLAFGRIPVLIADRTQLPQESIINYDEFIVRVPEADIENLESYLEHNDLERMSARAREVFTQYFTPDKFADFLKRTVKRQVGFI